MSENENNEVLEDLSAFAVEEEEEVEEAAAPEDFSKYEVEAKRPALNNGNLSGFAHGFPDFVVSIKEESTKQLLAEKIAERKAAVQ